MATMTDTMREAFARITGTSLAPTVETVDPTQNVFYTSFELYGGAGNGNRPGLATTLYLEDVAKVNKRVELYGAVTPECPPDFYNEAGGVGMLPGMFERYGVPFSAGELNSAGPHKGEFERTYKPGPRQKLEAGIAIWHESMRFVKYAAVLHDDYTLADGHFGMHYPSGDDGDWPMRSLNLKRFIEMMNNPRVQDRIVEDLDNWLMTQESFGTWRPHYVLSDSPWLGTSGAVTVDSSNPLAPGTITRQSMFPLPSIRPTQAEWEDQWGAQDFFERGGYLIDLNVARGRIPVTRNHNFAHLACAAWCRAPKARDVYPSGAPQCVLPISAMTSEVSGWTTTINITGPMPADIQVAPVYDGLYRLLIAPQPKSTWKSTVDSIASGIESGIRALCSHDDTAAKAMVALIAFLNAQGKDAATAQAKAKTVEQKKAAAELADKYRAGVLELTVAVTAANAWCAANPVRGGIVLPTGDLPAVPPPVNTKFGFSIQDIFGGRVVANQSPETATSPTNWSAAALIGLGLLGAAGGALAFHRKRK